MVRACCEALQPAVSMLEPYVRRLEPLARAAVAAVEPRARAAAAWADQHAAALSPWQLVLLTIAATLLAVRVLQALRRVAITVKDKGEAGGRAAPSGFLLLWGGQLARFFSTKPAGAQACRCHRHRPSACPSTAPHKPSRCAGWRQLVAGFVLDLPLLRGRVAREQAALAEKIREDLRKKAAGGRRIAGQGTAVRLPGSSRGGVRAWKGLAWHDAGMLQRSGAAAAGAPARLPHVPPPLPGPLHVQPACRPRCGSCPRRARQPTT